MSLQSLIMQHAASSTLQPTQTSSVCNVSSAVCVCIHCSLQTDAAQLKGLRTFRNIDNDKCDSDSCGLKKLTTDTKTFADACDRYAGTVSALDV
jgi:hypothetical protein